MNDKPLLSCQMRQIFRSARRKIVKNNDFMAFAKKFFDQMAADKACSTRDQATQK